MTSRAISFFSHLSVTGQPVVLTVEGMPSARAADELGRTAGPVEGGDRYPEMLRRLMI